MPARKGLGEHKYGHEELKRRIYVLQQTDSPKPKLACGERIKDQRRRGDRPAKRQKQAIDESAPECPGSRPCPTEEMNARKPNQGDWREKRDFGRH